MEKEPTKYSDILGIGKVAECLLNAFGAIVVLAVVFIIAITCSFQWSAFFKLFEK